MADRDRFGGSDRDYAYTDYSGRQGLDVRNPGDYAIQRAHSYPSNRQPLLNQSPMEGPPQRPHVNPRLRHINPRGMAGGLGGLQGTTDLWQDIHPYTWNRMMHGPEFQGTTTPYGYNQPDEYGRMRPTLPNPYEGATIGGGWDDDYRTMEELKRANPGWWDQQIEPEGIMEALPDEDQTSGLWQDWKRIFERTGNAELADFWISSQQAV